MYWIEEDAGESRHFSFGRESRRALLVLLLSALAVVGCTTWIDRRMQPGGEEAVSVPLPVTPPPAVEVQGGARIRIRIPVEGASPDVLRDSFHDKRGGRLHQAIDIMAPRGTPVLAAVAGEVAKVYRHPLGGLSVYQYDEERRFAFYYAHLDAFAEGLKAGTVLAAGDAIGSVGTTGNATPGSPHLHFAVYRLGRERQWWRGTPVNPYELLKTGSVPGLTPPPTASP